MGEVAAAVEAVLEGRAQGRRRSVNEEMGEARTESLVWDAGEAVVGVAGESGAPGGSMTHRDRLLEDDADAAARGVFDGLLGLVVEFVVPQAVTVRSHRGVRLAQEHARPTRPTGGRVAVVHATHDGEGSIV